MRTVVFTAARISQTGTLTSTVGFTAGSEQTGE